MNKLAKFAIYLKNVFPSLIPTEILLGAPKEDLSEETGIISPRTRNVLLKKDEAEFDFLYGEAEEPAPPMLKFRTMDPRRSVTQGSLAHNFADYLSDPTQDST